METTTLKLDVNGEQIEIELSLTEVLAIQVPTYKISHALDISASAEAKQAGETVQHSVDFTFDNFTVKDLLDRLLISSSPVVTFQNSHRGKAIPKAWSVNKAGTKAAVKEPMEAQFAKLDKDAQRAKLDQFAKLAGFESFADFTRHQEA
jgi:hypothetical protein